MGRGQVMKILPEDKYKIFLVDEGYVDVVEKKSLRTIPQCFMRFPMLAIRIYDREIHELMNVLGVDEVVSSYH